MNVKGEKQKKLFKAIALAVVFVIMATGVVLYLQLSKVNLQAFNQQMSVTYLGGEDGLEEITQQVNLAQITGLNSTSKIKYQRIALSLNDQTTSLTFSELNFKITSSVQQLFTIEVFVNGEQALLPETLKIEAGTTLKYQIKEKYTLQKGEGDELAFKLTCASEISIYAFTLFK